MQGKIDPITGSKLSENCVIDHLYYLDWGEHGQAFFVQHLPIRGVLNRTSNQFEGKVAAYFIRQGYPLKVWSEKLRNLSVDDYVACENIFLDIWNHPFTRLKFADVASNLASYWEQPSPYLCYPYKVKSNAE